MKQPETPNAGSLDPVVIPQPDGLKNYQVKIIAYAIVLVVKAESEEKAILYATEEVSAGDFEIDETTIECEVPDDRLENAKRHAHTVALPDEV